MLTGSGTAEKSYLSKHACHPNCRTRKQQPRLLITWVARAGETEVKIFDFLQNL